MLKCLKRVFRLSFLRGTVKDEIILVGIFIIGVGLRLLYLDKFTLWYDELITAQWSYDDIRYFVHAFGISPLKVMVMYLESDLHPPLYYLLIYCWTYFLGDSSFSLRILSVLLSSLTSIVVYKFARMFFNKNVSIGAFALFLLSPMQIWYAQEARSYALCTFLGVVLIYVYMRALKDNKAFFWGMYLLVGMLALYSNYMFIFLFMGFGVPFIFKENREFCKKWIFCTSVIFLSFGMCLLVFVEQLKHVVSFSWIGTPIPKSIIITLTNFILGYNLNPVYYLYLGVGFICCFIYGIFRYSGRRENVIILVSYLFFPILGSYIFSKLIANIYLDRTFLPFSFLFYLFVSSGVLSVHRKALRIIIVLISLFFIVVALLYYYQGKIWVKHQEREWSKDEYEIYHMGVHVKEDERQAFEFLEAHISEGDILASTDAQADLIMRQYFRLDKHPSKKYNMVRLFMPKYNDHPLHVAQKLHYLIRGTRLNIEKYKNQNSLHFLCMDKIGKIEDYRCPRIWLITSFWDKGIAVGYEAKFAREYLDMNYKRKSFFDNGSILIELYEQMDGKQKEYIEKSSKKTLYKYLKYALL